MASPFINATFLNLTDDRDVCHDIAYLGRTAIDHQRLQQTIDMTSVAPDLAYSEIRLPHDAPAAFEDIQLLANAADQADARHMRKTTDRKRWPQVAAALIIALPPDDEVTLDEALELVQRIVDRIIGGRGLVAITAIHDPALMTSGARNRHGHVLLLLRNVDGDGFGHKVRDLFARARLGARATYYIAEGIDWPTLSAQMQQALFAELASDIVVDPPAPFSDRRWPETTMRNDPVRVAKHRREIRNKNIEFIYGPADALVDRLLRGRSVVLVQELRQLLARFIDGETDRRDRLDEILADPAIVTLAAHAGEPRPSRLTTRAVHDMMMRATSLVDRAAKKRDAAGSTAVPPRLAVVSGPTAAMVDRAIATFVETDKPLLVGALSDCAALQKELGEQRPTVISVAALVHSMDRDSHGVIPHDGLVVVARSHAVPDQALAAIMAAAEARQASLVLGYDESQCAGVADNRLAAYAADALAPSCPDGPYWTELQLRSGLVDRAVAALNEQGLLRFAATDEPLIGNAKDFVVCDDVKRFDGINERVTAARAATDNGDVSFEVAHPRRTIKLSVGQWIAITKTDYTVRPPIVIEGRLGQVVEPSVNGRSIRVQLAAGPAVMIDLDRHPYLRPAFAISIREARRTPPASTLLIDLTQRNYAWGALLLAASRDPSRVIVRVDPAVAQDVEELSCVARASLPGALPAELKLTRDPVVTLQPILGVSQTAPETDVTEQAPIDFDAWIEYLRPEGPPLSTPLDVERRVSSVDDRPSRARSAIPADLHGDLRAILARADCEPALRRLRTALAPETSDRQQIADRLLDPCEPEGPVAALITALMQPEHQGLRDPMAELDLPSALAAHAPRSWCVWDLYKCRMDLRTMSIRSSHWERAFNPASTKISIEPDRKQNPLMGQR
jgi:hypothetical protein